MGRELKRVSLNFDWPINETWSGYLNPHYEGHCSDCPDCNGRGSTLALQRLEDIVGLLMLSAGDLRDGRPHPYFDSSSFYNTRNIVTDKDIVELTTGLAGRASSFMGHDSCDRWNAVRAIIKAAGLTKSWGTCQKCNGEGSVWDSKKNKNRAARWRRKGPPEGEGYQIWETVSEGSPISPVFDTPEKLADWMSKHGAWGADHGTSREQWLRFINGPGWAPSLMGVNGHLSTGVQAVTDFS